MRAELNPLFGVVPDDAANLEIVGVYARRFELNPWATVWPDSGVIRWLDGSIETETIWRNDHLKLCGDYYSRWSRFPRRMHGQFFNLSLFWWSNYYHWFCDVLPRLYRVFDQITPDLQIILPQRLSTLHRRTLELVGVPLSQCIQHAGRRPWKVQVLHYASPVSMTGDHEPQSLQWMRSKIFHHCLGRSSVSTGNRRLYITRRQAVFRRVANETELLPILQNFGFEVVEPESMSFEEQVRIFSEAAVIAGPHGAGMTNMLWCGRGAKIFEIFEQGSVRRCYWSLARALGHVYACGVGDIFSNQGSEPDLVVKPDFFKMALKKLCNGL